MNAAQSATIPRTVWALGLVSLFMDASSELVHSLLPLYLVGTLGATPLLLGLIEGVAEATAMIVKIFSGALSDFIGRRKALLLAGYGLAALSKPLFPLADSVETVFAARILDRIGKGIRGAPRDALIVDVTPPQVRGASFGLRETMDTIGAILGPLLAIALMAWLADIRLVLWLAVVPAALCVVLIVFMVQEPTHGVAKRGIQSPIHPATLGQFSAAYWLIVGVGVLFMLARFSQAFLLLQAQQVGFHPTWVPLVVVLMSMCYALSAYPAGWLSDRISRSWLLAASLVLLALADVVLAQAASISAVLLGSALWGLHLGFSQGVLSALVADHTPETLKGTAFGVFNAASGLAMLVASILAGWLWQTQGAAASFYAGAIFAVLALVLLLAQKR